MKRLFKRHFEWIAFSLGLTAMAVMNPYIENGISWCLFESLGITFCPGNGLGHSIALLFRGDYIRAIEANFMGPVAVAVIVLRVLYLLHSAIFKRNDKLIYNNG